MNTLNRRTLLAGSTAVAAAGLMSPVSLSMTHAAAPMAGKQVPGYYRYKVGAYEVTTVADGVRPTPLPDTVARNASKEALAAAFESLYPGQVRERLTYTFTPVVVNTGAKLVAIDTGTGPGTLAQSNGALGQYHDNLASAGIARDAVDTVIISHFHGDHIGGLITADGKPAFPNAEIMVPTAEWAHWMDDAKMNAAPEAARGGFQNVRRVFGALGKQVSQYMRQARNWCLALRPSRRTAIRPATLRTSFRQAPAASSFSPTSRPGRQCSSRAIRHGNSRRIRTPQWRSKRVANSMTWLSPKKCSSWDITSHSSRASISRRTATDIA
jgi:hypothetical protein